MSAFLLALVLAVPQLALNAYALLQLWGWFVVPLGAPRLGYGSALGLAVLFGFLLARYSDDDEDPVEGVVKRFMFGVISALYALGVGWLIHGFAGGTP